jgi:folate-binding protein YgfZ
MTHLFSLENRAFVRVEGPGAPDFLNRLLTLDCKRLAVGQPSRAFLLEARGRVVLALRVLRLEATAFELEAADAEPVLERLDHFHFGENLRFSAARDHVHLLLAGSEVDAILAAAGIETGAFCTDQDVAVLPTDRLEGARELWVRADARAAVEAALVAAGAQPAGLEVLESLRVFQGIAGDGEYGPEATPLEVGLAGITEGKGCYPGQEVIERTLALGRPARTLIRVALSGELPVGSELMCEGDTAGRLTSVALGPDGMWVGLALVRPKLAAGPFEAGGVAVSAR